MVFTFGIITIFRPYNKFFLFREKEENMASCRGKEGNMDSCRAREGSMVSSQTL